MLGGELLIFADSYEVFADFLLLPAVFVAEVFGFWELQLSVLLLWCLFCFCFLLVLSSFGFAAGLSLSFVVQSCWCISLLFRLKCISLLAMLSAGRSRCIVVIWVLFSKVRWPFVQEKC
ncbi:hypothetical protein U1Q18_006580 [Sarracenia purpurea var. burkii]